MENLKEYLKRKYELELLDSEIYDIVELARKEISLLSIKTSAVFSLTDSSKYICGIGGLAKLVGCSYPTALKYKNSGRIPYLEIGKKIYFDREKVLQVIYVVNKKG